MFLHYWHGINFRKRIIILFIILCAAIILILFRLDAESLPVHVIMRTSQNPEKGWKYSEESNEYLKRQFKDTVVTVETVFSEKKPRLQCVMEKAMKMYPNAKTFTFINADIILQRKEF